VQFFGFPLIPILAAVVAVLIFQTSYAGWEKSLEEKKGRLFGAFVEKGRYEVFFQEYPQKQSFDLEKALSSLTFLLDLQRKIKEFPPLKRLPFVDEKVLDQKIFLKNGKTRIQSPYMYIEKSFEKPILMDQKDLLSFLKKIEEHSLEGFSSLGAGDLYFQYFHIKKTKNPFGTFYLVDAKITEKRGAL
jgi:hypothetical protein